jgi:hypothetical protein
MSGTSAKGPFSPNGRLPTAWQEGNAPTNQTEVSTRPNAVAVSVAAIAGIALRKCVMRGGAVTPEDNQRRTSQRELPTAFWSPLLLGAIVVPIQLTMAPSMVLIVTKLAKDRCLFDSTRFAKASPSRSDQAARVRSRFSF